MSACVSALEPVGGRAQRAAAGAGLVYLSTKRTDDGLVEFDPVHGRVLRLARSVDHSARELHFSCASDRSSRYRSLFVTLTYRSGVEWSPLHMRAFVSSVRHWFLRRGSRCRMVWVAELQKRGAVHYHAVVWVPRRFRFPAPDVQGWWPHGMSNLQRARAPVGYLTKYASKGVEPGQRFPRGCRTHGCSGLERAARSVVRWWCAPGWVRESMRAAGVLGADVVRSVGGWVDRNTGFFLRSPWHIWMPGNGRVFFYKVEAA